MNKYLKNLDMALTQLFAVDRLISEDMIIVIAKDIGCATRTKKERQQALNILWREVAKSILRGKKIKLNFKDLVKAASKYPC